MNSSKNKIGILGGTFDPIHNGHIKIAREVKDRLGLRRILFIPAGKPWQKAERRVTPAQHRVKMVELAINGVPYFEVSLIEVERPGSTYTVDTLKELRRIYDGTELYFILGWDALLGAPYWKEPEKIINLCYVVAVPRPRITPPDPVELDRIVPGIAKRLITLDAPQIDISSSDIRERIAAGMPLGHMLPERVAEYIKKNNLYSVKGG